MLDQGVIKKLQDSSTLDLELDCPALDTIWIGGVFVCGWGTHGNRLHYGKKASQQRRCNDLGNFQQGHAEVLFHRHFFVPTCTFYGENLNAESKSGMAQSRGQYKR